MQSRLYENLVVKQTGKQTHTTGESNCYGYISRYIGIIRFLRLNNSFTRIDLTIFRKHEGKHVMNTGYRWSTSWHVICPCPLPPPVKSHERVCRYKNTGEFSLFVLSRYPSSLSFFQKCENCNSKRS